MKTNWLLRSAAIVMLLHELGHTIGALSWRETTDPAKQQVINAMTGDKFSFMGAARSMGEYYHGYGLITILALLLLAAILWIGSEAGALQGPVFKLLIVSAIVLFSLGIIELLFFFPLAALFSLTAGGLTTTALIRARGSHKT